MISSKTKTKLPPAKKAVAAPGKARKLAALSDLDREAAIELVRARTPSLVLQCGRLNVELAENLVRSDLFSNRVGFPFQVDEPGEPKITTDAAGLVVSRDGRSGLVTWLELAGEFCGNDFDDEETDPADDITGAMDLADDEPAERPVRFREASLKVDEILTTGRNERQHFDETALAEMAETMQRLGVLEPLVVRESIGKEGAMVYELVAGERRLRAARLAGLAEVPCRVGFALAPETVDEIRVIENLQREDLSAIEKARGFRRMLAEHGYTQEKLAARLGKTQGYVGNLLGLLKLPETWQQRVISQEIPPTHARALLPYAEFPAILDAVEKRFYRKGKLDEEYGIGPVGEFTRDVEDCVDHVTKPVTGSHYEYRLGRSVEIFTPTDKERAQLGIVTFGKEQRATNVKLWEKLRTKQIKPLVDKKYAAQSKASRGGKSPTKSEVSEETYRRQLAGWRINWLQFLLARLATIPQYTSLDRANDLCRRILLLQLGDAEDMVTARDVAPCVGLRGAIGYDDKARAKVRQAVLACADPDNALRVLGARCLWAGPFDKTGKPTSYLISEEAVEDLAAHARLDLAEAWQKELAGPLTEAFFNLHDVPRLCALGASIDVYVKPNLSKTAAIARLKNHANTKRKLPACIAPVAPAKAAKKPAAKKPATRKR